MIGCLSSSCFVLFLRHVQAKCNAMLGAKRPFRLLCFLLRQNVTLFDSFQLDADDFVLFQRNGNFKQTKKVFQKMETKKAPQLH